LKPLGRAAVEGWASLVFFAGGALSRDALEFFCGREATAAGILAGCVESYSTAQLLQKSAAESRKWCG
jgi:hypothetical protein